MFLKFVYSSQHRCDACNLVLLYYFSLVLFFFFFGVQVSCEYDAWQEPLSNPTSRGKSALPGVG